MEQTVEKSLSGVDPRSEEVADVVEHHLLPMSVAVRYLRTYVGFNADWERHLGYVWNRLRDPEKMRNLVCCAILLPAVDRSTYIDLDHPENLLLKVGGFHQLGERNWFELFKSTFEKDIAIDKWRMEALGLGIVDPIDYHPNHRQAFRWLYEHAQSSGVVTTEEVGTDVANRFRRLVQTYGGAVICNIFSRHENTIAKLVNWRTGYFFERNIFNVYKPDDVMKIKASELQRVNKSLVKTIKFA